ncbi:MAG: type III secretion system chaperone [Desulfovibrio sp.]|nr:type III secretion system chaperone [Desulfovibrio sp.]
MNSEKMISELGRALGIDLKFSDAGVCGVMFDNDEIILERHEDQLYLIAELGPASAREDAYKRLLTANYLGLECGQGTVGIDKNREEFVLHRLLDGEMDYVVFEKILATFVQTVRYWKEWLAEPKPMVENNARIQHLPSGSLKI